MNIKNKHINGQNDRNYLSDNKKKLAGVKINKIHLDASNQNIIVQDTSNSVITINLDNLDDVKELLQKQTRILNDFIEIIKNKQKELKAESNKAKGNIDNNLAFHLERIIRLDRKIKIWRILIYTVGVLFVLIAVLAVYYFMQPRKIANIIKYPAMVRIESGRYKIGPSFVFVDSFYISKYEITNQEYNEFLKDKQIDTIIGKSKKSVSNVSWYDAIEYCYWLSDKTGQRYRLPYEIEWEIAAKGETENLYPWGDELPDKHNCNFKYSFFGSPINIDTVPYNISENGVVNMSGNVAEWCYEWYHDDYYKIIGDYIVNGKMMDLPQKFVMKVIRGGSYNDIASDVSIVSRKPAKPDIKEEYIGFRIVKICQTK